MSGRFSMSQVLKAIKAGPSNGQVPTAAQVKATAARYPKQYSAVLSRLFYLMVDDQFRRPRADMIARYEKFSRPWRGDLSDDASRFYFCSLDAYRLANTVGFRDLDWSKVTMAQSVASELSSSMPEAHSVEGLAWRCLLGQIQSIYSRDDASATFKKVQSHEDSSLAVEFTRNIGAFTYFSEDDVRKRRRDLPSLEQLQSWQSKTDQGSDRAIVIAMDVHFFRIYAAMIMFNAQQVRDIDFIFLVCAPSVEAQQLYSEADGYLSALSSLNKQDKPNNVRFISIQTPAWVGDERTFYACSRFIALPGLLDQYLNVYAMDADLFMIKHPGDFMRKVSRIEFGVTRTEGLHGVPPWRRYMAGNVVANQKAKDSLTLKKVLDYLSVGLAERYSWTLDQNALCYGVESTQGGYEPITLSRPMSVGSFVGHWERNYRASLNVT